MRSINLRIAAGSRTVAAFGALKQFDPTRLLGPTLALLRAGDPLTIDLTGAADAFGCLERVLALLDQLDELQIPYEIDILVLPEDADYDREAGPVWVLRRVTKAQFAAAAADWRPRSARVPEAPPESPASALNDKIRRLRSILDERWQRLGFEALLPAEQDYILIWGLNAEVSSGTFDQYLCNSSGDRALETAAALRRAGAEIVLAILEELLRAIPGGVRIAKSAGDAWTQCRIARQSFGSSPTSTMRR